MTNPGYSFYQKLDMDWIAEHWLEFASLALMAAGIWSLMPPGRMPTKILGLLLALAGTGGLAVRMHAVAGPPLETGLFFLFSAGSIVCAILMITNHNPVYSALWFALSTLNICGLFLLQFAPFLAAATVIVYAGAIVVTFVFVIMLAQQGGTAIYDQRARQPLAATVGAFVLLGAVLSTFEAGDEPTAPETATNAVPSLSLQAPANTEHSGVRATSELQSVTKLGRPMGDESLASIHALGRSLFGDYLLAVELAGTLLLIATIGAIAIAPRRRRGTL